MANPQNRPVPRYGSFLMIGSEMAGFTIVGVILDLWLDVLPWLTVVLTLLGMIAGMWHLWQVTQKRQQAPPSNPGE